MRLAVGEWRETRARLRLEDAEEYLHRWAFSMSPSERHRWERRIERRRRRLARLSVPPERSNPVPPRER